MSEDHLTIEEGKPLRLHDLDTISLANYLHEKRIRTTQGKVIQPLHTAHKNILTVNSRYTVWAAGRRSAKTLGAAIAAMAILMQPNRRVWIVAPTYNHAEKVFKEVHNWLVTQLKLVVPSKEGHSVRNQKGDFYIKTPWGSVLEAKSMERPDSLAGEALDFIIVDEAALQPNLEDIWVQMLAPTLMDKKGGALLISSPRGRNDFYKMFLQGQLGNKQRTGEEIIQVDKETNISNDMRDWAAFKTTSYDNPLLSSTPEESKEEIDAKYREALLSGKLIKFKQEYLADFDAVSDVVFPEFIIDKSDTCEYPNVVDYTWHPDAGPIFSAHDFNYARPASSLFLQVNSYGDCIIFDERFTDRTTASMQARQVLEKERELQKTAYDIWNKEGYTPGEYNHIYFQKIIGDISGDQNQLNGRSAFDDFQEVLGVRPVGIKQPRSVGCDMIRQRLRFPLYKPGGEPELDKHGMHKTVPRLFIARNCVNLIYALSSAKFKASKHGLLKEDYDEHPAGYEGLLDALRYALVYIYHDKKNYFQIVGGY